METFRYLSDVTTLKLDKNACTGCGVCLDICPHAVYQLSEKKAVVVDKDACMECGACAKNCPSGALTVTPGVGCASYIIQTWTKGKEVASCGDGCC